jgi:hypothetical protein
MPKVNTPVPRRVGNPVARSPLLRKGGVHQRSRSGERRLQRQALVEEVEKWQKERGAAR